MTSSIPNLSEDPITEFCILTLKPGIDLSSPPDDDSSDAWKTWRKILATLSAAEGCTGCYYGVQMEDTEKMVLCIEWTSPHPLQRFTSSPHYPSFLTLLSSIRVSTSIILLSSPSLPRPSISQPSTLTLPTTTPSVIEVCIFGHITSEFLAGVAQFKNAVEKLDPRPKGWLGDIGWGVEGEGEEGGKEREQKEEKRGEGKSEKDGKEGEKEEKKGEKDNGRQLILTIGWKTREDHLAFRQTPNYQKVIPYLMKGTSGLEMFHVPFTEFEI